MPAQTYVLLLLAPQLKILHKYQNICNAHGEKSRLNVTRIQNFQGSQQSISYMNLKSSFFKFCSTDRDGSINNTCMTDEQAGDQIFNRINRTLLLLKLDYCLNTIHGLLKH